MVDDPTILRQIRFTQRSPSPMTLSDTEQMEYMANTNPFLSLQQPANRTVPTTDFQIPVESNQREPQIPSNTHTPTEKMDIDISIDQKTIHRHRVTQSNMQATGHWNTAFYFKLTLNWNKIRYNKYQITV